MMKNSIKTFSVFFKTNPSKNTAFEKLEFEMYYLRRN